MRVTRRRSLLLSLGLGLSLVLPASAQVKAPPDFAFPQGKESPGPVTFSHEQHKAKIDKCTACHTKVFKFKKGTSGTVTMAAIREGNFCGACHNGKTEIGGTVVFSTEPKENCEKCHKKQ